MTTGTRWIRGSLGLAICASVMPAVETAFAADASVELLANRQAATPGETVALAVRFLLADETFIFWRDPGAVGEPTIVSWTGPAGTRFGPTRFPTPEKEEVRPGIQANVLTGEPVLLGSLEIPHSAKPGKDLVIRADVSFAVGGNDIAPQKRTLELTLPVGSPGQKAEPANQEVFEDAAYSQPVPIGKAKHIKLNAALEPKQIAVGGQAEITIHVDVKKGFHIQAHEPGVEGLVGVDLFLLPPEGVEVGGPSFPEGKARKVKYLGTVKEYGGQAKFGVPITLQPDFAGPASLSGLLLYQACSDKTGMCYPPEYVEWSVEIPAVE